MGDAEAKEEGEEEEKLRRKQIKLLFSMKLNSKIMSKPDWMFYAAGSSSGLISGSRN